MIHERTTITLKEFVKDVAEYVEEIASGNEVLFVATESGNLVELRPAKKNVEQSWRPKQANSRTT